MRIFLKDFKANLVPSVGIGILLAIFMTFIIVLYPEFSKDLAGIVNVFSNVSIFTDALNMDMSLIGKLIGYYGMELEMLVGLFGGVFVAFLGGNLLIKEEKEHTAEFLLTQPVHRLQVALEKILSFLFLITLFNLIISCASYIVIQITGQSVDLNSFIALHLAVYISHINVFLLSLAVTELLPKRIANIGPVLVIILYLLNVLYNMNSNFTWVQLLTPYAYTSSADIIKTQQLNLDSISINILWTSLLLIIGLWRYQRRDIAA